MTDCNQSIQRIQSNQDYTKSSSRKQPRRENIFRQRMLEDMQLNHLSENTQNNYIRGVRKLARHYKRSPEKISEKEVRDFILFLLNDSGLTVDTIRVVFYGVKFFYQKTLGMNWEMFDLIRLPQPKHLPIVLSFEEVKKVLSHIHHPTYRMALNLIYACGLRLSECLNLRVEDIDRHRMTVRVKGKGNKVREIPIPEHVLRLLRKYWHQSRPHPWLFKSRWTDKPISVCCIQAAFRDARVKANISKKATIHTLRHSYATHLLENGVDVRIIQGALGHRSPNSTRIYTHLTSKTDLILNHAVNQMMCRL